MIASDVLGTCEEDMQQALDKLASNFKKLRTGRATTEIFDTVKCDYYGNPTPINQMCNITASDGQSLLVKPFDRKNLGDVERAIQKANLGVSVTNDGVAVRVQIPPLNEERRKSIVAEAKGFSEDSKVKARDARREANKVLDSLKKEGLSEDDLKKAKEDVNDLLKKYEKKIDSAFDQKSQEILSM